MGLLLPHDGVDTQQQVLRGLAQLVSHLEFQETGTEVCEKISPTLQPVVDGRGGVLPLRVKPAP